MSTREDIQKRLIQAIDKKLGKKPYCAICGNRNWIIPDHYIPIAVSGNPKHKDLGGKILPLVPMACSNCGNTHLINLLALGFKEEELKTLKYKD